MNYIHLLAGPAVGAVIGYCTNYIAVKMLFKPLEPVYVFGKKLPLTPGVIPKNKGRIARALGQAISKSLLTEEDLGKAFLKPEAKEQVVCQICEKLSGEEFQTATPEKLAETYLGEERSLAMKNGVKIFVADKITDAVTSFDIEKLISTVGIPMLMNRIQGSMLAMFLNEETVYSFLQPIAGTLKGWLQGPGRGKIGELVSVEMDKLFQTPMGELADIGEQEAAIKAIIGQLYERCVEKIIPVVIAELDIASLVEEKVEAMDVGFLENLILSIMKTELDYVVNIGAFIGFVIGCINVFI
ncbi:MAG: DUF445 family protein [Firmicutes bacterium]|nr:DUF445 family protein [Bacillota bacterium]